VPVTRPIFTRHYVRLSMVALVDALLQRQHVCSWLDACVAAQLWINNTYWYTSAWFASSWVFNRAAESEPT
jgi:hypothetical protein